MNVFRIVIILTFSFVMISCGGAEERKAVYMEKAKSSIESGDLDKARIELKNVLQIDPKDGAGYYQLGRVYEAQKDYRKAYANYIKAEELAPDLLANQARLGRFYLLLMNDLEKAQEKIDYILNKEPENSDGLLLQAAYEFRKNNVDKAITMSKRMLEDNPAHAEGAAFLATLYIREDKFDDAIAVLDKALAERPNNENLNSLLAAVLVKNKDYERAEMLYKTFLKENSDSTLAYNNLARFYDQTGDKANAEAVLRDSINNDPNNEDRILVLIKYLQTSKGNVAAIEELEKYVADNKGFGRLRTGLAELYLINKDKQSAISVYESAIKDFSEEVTGVNARAALAALYIIQKSFDKATLLIEDAISISPNDPRLNLLRAKLALRDNNLEKAILSLRIVIKETPENVDAFILLANIYKKQENSEQVQSVLNSAYESNKANSASLLKLAQYQLTNNVEQAEKIINHYNAINESDYDGLSLKAAILNNKQEFSEGFEVAAKLMTSFSDKPNGYLQSMPYYQSAKDVKGAIATLEKGHLNVKDNKKILTLLISFLVSEEQYADAISLLKNELKTAPDTDVLKLLLSKVYLASNDTDSAIKLLNDMRKNNTQSEEAYLLLSNVYQGQSKSDTAVSVLEDGVENNPSSIRIRIALAGVLELTSNYKRAIEVYREAHNAFPDNLIIANNYASLLSMYGQNKDDFKLAKSIITKLMDTKQPVFLDTIGWVHYKVGESAEAIKYLLRAVEKQPDVNIFNYHLGMAYKLSGDNSNAKIYLEKSLSDNNAFKDRDRAEAALKELE